jgi:ABC-2 type transport system ATP-binding protein
MTILTTSHLLADAEDMCDRVAILNRGEKVAEGKIGDLGSSLSEFFLAKVGEGRRFERAEFLK